MTDVRQLSPAVIRELIDLYRESPCLWKIKSEDYLNKVKKNEAYEKLLNVVKPHYCEANKDFIIKKINSLRSSFRRELKRIKDSKRSGKGEDDIYKSNLWYFDLLLFTTDQETPRDSRSNIIQQEKENRLDFIEAPLFNEDDIIEYIDPSMESDRSTCASGSAPLKKKRKDKNNNAALEKAYETLNKEEDEFDAVGFAIAAKLRKISKSDDTQRIFAENLINRALFKAELGVLTASMDI